jgi:tetratricopeptide (TPR) repeat protein
MLPTIRLVVIFCLSAVALAGADDTSRPTREARQEIDSFLEQLESVLRDAESGNSHVYFDGDEMLALWERRGFRATTDIARDVVTDLIARQFGEILEKRGDMFKFDRRKVDRLRISEKGDSADVVVRYWDDEGVSVKLRWWLRRSTKGWRVVDLDDLALAIRWSSFAVLGAAGGDANKLMPVAIKIQTAASQVNRGEPREALDAIASVIEPPALLARMLLSLKMVALSDLELAEEVLETGAMLRRLDAGIPLVEYATAVAHNDVHEFAKALEAVRRCEDLSGVDSITLLERGMALRGLGRLDEAVVCFRRALEDDPQNGDALAEFALTLPEEKKGEFAAHFARLDDPSAWFGSIAVKLRKSDDGPALAVLVDAYRKIAPQDVRVDFNDAVAKMLDGSFLDAARALEKHLPNDDLAEHEEVVSLWLEVLLSAGEYERAYRDCSDKSFAFETLIDWLEVDENARGLLRLAELHGKIDPDSAWIDATRGTAYLLLGNFAAADAAFLAAEGKEVDEPESIEYFRSQRARVQVAADKGLELYRSEPTRASFERIGYELEVAKKVEAFRALVAERRVSQPQEKDLPLWEARVAYLSRDYSTMVRLLEMHRNAIVARADNLETFDDLIVRALVRVGRWTDAMEEAERIFDDDECRLYIAMVHCAAGRVNETAKSLRFCLDGRHDPSEVENDEEFGPLIRTLKFRSVRERFSISSTPITER